ncbi:sensor histidine kinase [Geothrix rubra]|uniref:histidine kinase n=1 Tax=Geothrix rubra TaxID=2927977 RepID=A0ABQ5Q8E4_9BACT|nr:HAMP domain-containing sensor histidine kinase [Geothrix rubra]GLH70789.1 sensor histidine kinase [Geothrix rubra]
MSEPLPVPPAVDTPPAPDRRATPEQLQRELEVARESPLVGFLLESLHGRVALLNDRRQILAASPGLVEALGPRWGGAPSGERPGEVFGCVHAPEGPGGCGTSPACGHCGLLLTLLGALDGPGPREGECHLSMRREGRWEAVEYHVTATRLLAGGHPLLAVVFRDISAERRREVLERLFFHDVANILQGLQGWSEGLSEGTVHAEDAARRILQLSERLGQEVHSHRRLLQAERGRLAVAPSVLQGGLVLQEVQDLLERHPSAGGRRLALLHAPGPASFVSDPDLLLRVVYNMALNAVEASGPEETVRLSFGWQGNRPRFAVHNPAVIPAAIQKRIFQRSFSTKAPRGRGLGTYAMKLFGENLLQGRVGFESGPAMGTTFWILLPPRLEAPGAAGHGRA